MTDFNSELSKITLKYNEIIKEKETKSNKTHIEENINSLKDIKLNFSTKFSFLLDEISKIPNINEIEKEEEVSPASIKSIMEWEWQYLENSQRFIEEDGKYSVKGGGGGGSIYAYSSHTINHENVKFKVKFHQTESFGCGGFGLISKNHHNFRESRFSNSGNYPMFCLCCTGPWSAKRINKISNENMQHILKRENEKTITFEVNFDDMKFNIYDYKDELFGDYNLNEMDMLDDLVLIYYSGTYVRHSHEIIPE